MKAKARARCAPPDPPEPRMESVRASDGCGDLVCVCVGAYIAYTGGVGCRVWGLRAESSSEARGVSACGTLLCMYHVMLLLLLLTCACTTCDNMYM